VEVIYFFLQQDFVESCFVISWRLQQDFLLSFECLPSALQQDFVESCTAAWCASHALAPSGVEQAAPAFIGVNIETGKPRVFPIKKPRDPRRALLWECGFRKRDEVAEAPTYEDFEEQYCFLYDDQGKPLYIQITYLSHIWDIYHWNTLNTTPADQQEARRKTLDAAWARKTMLEQLLRDSGDLNTAIEPPLAAHAGRAGAAAARAGRRGRGAGRPVHLDRAAARHYG